MRIITGMNGLFKNIGNSVLPRPGSEEYEGCKADYVYADRERGSNITFSFS